MHSLVRHLAAPLLALAALCASPAAFALDTGDILVTSIKGDVHVVMNGTERSVRAGAVLELPASIRTGRDGSIDLAQGATTVSVGPESTLELPALAERGGPIDRIVQPRGNAFYSVGKRAGRRLRVETPYLVAVIKGTQFNVAALDASTTISLFEGLLEIHAADDSSVVDIKAGEIASLNRGDKSIGILKMDSKAPSTPRAPAAAGAASSTPGTAATRPGDDEIDGVLADRTVLGPTETVENVRGAAGDVAVSGNNVVTVGNTGVDVNTNVNVDVGVADVGADAAVNVGAAGAGVAANTNVDLPIAAVDVGANTNVEAGAGTVTANVDVGVNVAGVPAGVNTNVDVGAGTVNLGVTVAGTDLNVGLDLGLDDGNNGHGNDADHSDDSNPGKGKDPAPGLLDDLVKPRHRK
jgi:hypothetical protein